MTGDNSSWNETYADTLYAAAGSGNSSWNETYANTLYRLNSWDNFTGIPHATPSSGDTTNFSLAGEIYDWVVGVIATYTHLSNFTNDLGYINATHLSNLTNDLSISNYSHLSNFTDDLGDRGYTSNLNFSNDANYYNGSDFNISNYYNISEVDNIASAIAFDFFFTNHTSDISSHYDLVESDSGHVESSVVSDSLPIGSNVIFNFTTLSNQPEFSILRAGVYDVRLHLFKTGTRAVLITPKLYNVSSDGSVKNLLITFETSVELTTVDATYDLHGILSDEIILSVDDRLHMEFVADVSGGGSNPTVTLDMEGTTDTHLSIETSSNAFESIFVRQDGTKNMSGNLTFDVGAGLNWSWLLNVPSYSTIDEPLWAGNYTAYNTSWNADTTYTNGSAISLVGTQFNLTTCGDNEVWKMNGASWNCEADATGAGGESKEGDGVYLYNDTDTMYFNETVLNITIDDRDTDTTYTDNLNFTNGANYWNDTQATFNKTYADGLYADISVTGDNATWNETYADTLYAAAGSGNSSWNESYANTLYIEVGEEGNLNVNSSNSSDYWDDMGTINATQMEDNGGTLNILIAWLSSFIDSWLSGKNTDDLIEGSTNLYDNSTWNETYADGLYAAAGSGNSSWNESYADGLYAKYEFENNNFNGSGNFTTTGRARIGGTDTPTQKFVVDSGNVDTLAFFGLRLGNENRFLKFGNPASDVSHISVDDNDALAFGQEDLFADNGSTFVELMRIKRLGGTDNALVGINITDPQDTLHVGGNAIITGNLTVEKVVFENDNTHYIEDNSTCVLIYGDTSILEIC